MRPGDKTGLVHSPDWDASSEFMESQERLLGVRRYEEQVARVQRAVSGIGCWAPSKVLLLYIGTQTADRRAVPTFCCLLVPCRAPMVDEERVARLEAFSCALAEHNGAWAELQAEKKAGWESEAVDWRWKQLDASFQGRVDRTHHRGMVPSTRKYVRFYREWMPRLSAALFGRRYSADGASPSSRRPFFVDIGSAPGGMCEYLVGDLGWTGHASSLAPTENGFGMLFSHPDLGYSDADMSMPGAWRDLLAVVPECSCDFVNGGIVIDRGQSRETRLAVAPGGGPSSGSETGKAVGGAVAKAKPASEQDDDDPQQSHLHQTILQNECCFGLHALIPGGCLYFAYQRAAKMGMGMLFRILIALRPAFKRIRVTPTFAAGRTPVYCFCEGYAGRGTEEAASALSFLLSTPFDDFEGWNVTEWTAEVESLHQELEADLSHVWSECTTHLRHQRIEAEREFAAAMQASDRLLASSRGDHGHNVPFVPKGARNRGNSDDVRVVDREASHDRAVKQMGWTREQSKPGQRGESSSRRNDWGECASRGFGGRGDESDGAGSIGHWRRGEYGDRGPGNVSSAEAGHRGYAHDRGFSPSCADGRWMDSGCGNGHERGGSRGFRSNGQNKNAWSGCSHSGAGKGGGSWRQEHRGWREGGAGGARGQAHRHDG